MKKHFSVLLRAATLILALTLSLCLCACADGSPELPAVSDPQANAFDLIRHVYTDAELDAIAALAPELSLSELHAQYPVECLRQKAGGQYICYYVSSDRLLQLMYEADGTYVDLLNCLVTLYADEAVDTIRVGETVSEIRERFPDDGMPFLFLTTGTGEPKISDFYTRGGYCVTVKYGDDLKVSSISRILF